MRHSNSNFWNSIILVKDPCWHNITWKLGNSFHIRFWLDKWMEENTIMFVYPLLAELSLNINSLISEQGHYRTREWFWYLLTRRPYVNYVIEKQTLFKSLNTSHPMSDTTNHPIWSLHHSGKFIVNSCYKFLNFRGVSSPFISLIWNSITPLKVKVFFWLMLMRKLQTKEQLLKKNEMVTHNSFLW